MVRGDGSGDTCPSGKVCKDTKACAPDGKDPSNGTDPSARVVCGSGTCKDKSTVKPTDAPKPDDSCTTNALSSVGTCGKNLMCSVESCTGDNLGNIRCKGKCKARPADKGACSYIPSQGNQGDCQSGYFCEASDACSSLLCKGACKKVAKCFCDSPGKSGFGQNGYSCLDADGKEDKANCKDADQECINDAGATLQRSDVLDNEPISGVRCAKPVQPPPPSPPCAEYDKGTGRCLQVITGFGNISTDPSKFITRLYGLLLAASGGIAILLLMRAGYRIMTSRGNPEAIKEGQEQATATIVGLLFLIFAFVLLQVIASDLLRIPGITP